MVSAAVMGLDVSRLLERAEEMAEACAASVPVEKNPGVVLGVTLGVLATHGRDKVTLIVSPALYDLGAWLEQLLAESTGKEGKGLIPVDREPLGPPEVYGADRLFVYLRLASAPDEHQDPAVEALEGAGHPVVRITLNDLYDLGAEFFRWEFATAVAGSVLGVNAFNQPDVEASKVATRRLTDEYEKTGKLPLESPLSVSEGTLAAALGAHFRTSMQIGMVGLGRMGGNMARRLLRGGHEVVAYATDATAVRQLAGEGAVGALTLDDFVARLKPPRVAWVMVPAGPPTEQVVTDLA